MNNSLQKLDIVALLEDLPEKGLHQGQVGTVVEQLDGETFEIEFSDDQGRPYAFAALQATKLLPLRYQMVGNL